jgi:hypothetical protein
MLNYCLLHEDNRILDVLARDPADAKDQLQRLGELFKQVANNARVSGGESQYHVCVYQGTGAKKSFINLYLVKQ